MDVDGVTEECEHTSAVAVELARKAGALEIRVPRDAAERELMWKGARAPLPPSRRGSLATRKP